MWSGRPWCEGGKHPTQSLRLAVAVAFSQGFEAAGLCMASGSPPPGADVSTGLEEAYEALSGATHHDLECGGALPPPTVYAQSGGEVAPARCALWSIRCRGVRVIPCVVSGCRHTWSRAPALFGLVDSGGECRHGWSLHLGPCTSSRRIGAQQERATRRWSRVGQVSRTSRSAPCPTAVRHPPQEGHAFALRADVGAPFCWRRGSWCFWATST